MLGDGRAKSKQDAAAKAGLHHTALTPHRLGRHMPLAQSGAPALAITTDVDGKKVSLAEALSGGVKTAVGILQKAGHRLGKISKVERQRIKDAKMWLEMAKSMGLFAPPEPLALPAELQNQAQGEQSPAAEPAPEGGVSDFLGDPQTSAGDEDDASDSKVEA